MTNELFFQFIWQYSLYNSVGLKTVSGEDIIVQYPGKINHHAGPDFEEAKIKIGNTLLVGNVELHLKTSDWYRHGHQANRAYDSIILHIVWENDLAENPQDNVAVLEMRHCIPEHILKNYEVLQFTLQNIPCSAHLHKVNALTKEAWLTRLLAERWEMKFKEWGELLQQNAGDWRVLLYWRLAANFGLNECDAFPSAGAILACQHSGTAPRKSFSDRSFIFWPGRKCWNRSLKTSILFV